MRAALLIRRLGCGPAATSGSIVDTFIYPRVDILKELRRRLASEPLGDRCERLRRERISHRPFSLQHHCVDGAYAFGGPSGRVTAKNGTAAAHLLAIEQRLFALNSVNNVEERDLFQRT